MDALQVIAEPRRRKILALVWDREMAASDIAAEFEITFGAVSQHLSVLRDARFVTVRREGNHRFYKADRDVLEPFEDVLRAMWGGMLGDLARAAEEEAE